MPEPPAHQTHRRGHRAASQKLRELLGREDILLNGLVDDGKGKATAGMDARVSGRRRTIDITTVVAVEHVVVVQQGVRISESSFDTGGAAHVVNGSSGAHRRRVHGDESGDEASLGLAVLQSMQVTNDLHTTRSR